MTERKDLVAILGFTLVIALVAISAAVVSRQTGLNIPLFASSQKPLFYLWPKESSLGVGQTSTVQIHLNTHGRLVKAADMTLTYDPTLIKIVSGPLPGQIFESYVSQNLDSARGIISLGGRDQKSEEVLFGKFTIQALQKGKARVDFAYTKVDDLEEETVGAEFTIN